MQLPIPNVRSRPSFRLNHSSAGAQGVQPGLQGSAMPGSTGGVCTSGITYREVVAVPNATNVRVRILCAGAGAGTLNVKPIAPIATAVTDESVQDKNGWIDPSKVTAYATGTGTGAVAAVTEVKVDLALMGENYILIEFVCSATGTITWCDVSQLIYLQ